MVIKTIVSTIILILLSSQVNSSLNNSNIISEIDRIGDLRQLQNQTEYDNYVPILYPSSRINVRTDKHNIWNRHIFLYMCYNIDQDDLEFIQITKLPSNGTLEYKNSTITLNQVISDVSKYRDFRYISNKGFSGKDNILWKAKSRKGKNYSEENTLTLHVINDSHCQNDLVRASVDDKSCIPKCDNAYYVDDNQVFGNVCKPCNRYCKECTGLWECVKCEENYLLYGGVCFDKCPTKYGYFPINGTCVKEQIFKKGPHVPPFNINGSRYLSMGIGLLVFLVILF